MAFEQVKFETLPSGAPVLVLDGIDDDGFFPVIAASHAPFGGGTMGQVLRNDAGEVVGVEVAGLGSLDPEMVPAVGASFSKRIRRRLKKGAKVVGRVAKRAAVGTANTFAPGSGSVLKAALKKGGKKKGKRTAQKEQALAIQAKNTTGPMGLLADEGGKPGVSRKIIIGGVVVAVVLTTGLVVLTRNGKAAGAGKVAA